MSQNASDADLARFLKAALFFCAFCLCYLLYADAAKEKDRKDLLLARDSVSSGLNQIAPAFGP
jgi:hypothetical protein